MAVPDVTPLGSLLTSSQSVALILPQNPTYDAVSCALSLKLCLDAAGKPALVACSDPMTVEFNRLVGVDSIVRNFGGRNLVISFPDQTENVDKISYHIEAGELRLVVSPKVGSAPLDHTRLKFVSGSHADTIILVDVERLSDLGQIYEDSRDSFHSAPHKLVSITRNVPAESYASHQFYDSLSTSLVETVVQIAESLRLPFSSDAATNLLVGLEKSTDNFRHPRLSARTFEIAAYLMKLGARRHYDTISAESFPSGSIPQSEGTAEKVQEIKDPPPDDWTQPKIYRGPMLQ